VATEPVRAGEDKPIPAEGIEPDITIQVTLVEEQAYLKNPFRVNQAENREPSGVSTRRVTEADLECPSADRQSCPASRPCKTPPMATQWIG
jgi:hypothetical protein